MKTSPPHPKSSVVAFSVLVVLAAINARGAGPVIPAVGDFPIGAVGTKDLLSDQIFMNAMWHMAVEQVDEEGPVVTVTTTGATFRFDPEAGTVAVRHRLGTARPALTLAADAGALAGLRVVARDTGAVILTSEAGVRLKVNCDSMLMLRSQAPCTLRMRLGWQPDEVYPAGDARLVMDPLGAVALLPIRGATRYGPEVDGAAIYKLEAGGECWISIGPPRPYRWEDSLSQRLIWQGSWLKPELAVPADAKIRQWSRHGNILWLQSEAMLWKSWHQAYEPRLPAQFERVIQAAHDLGLRVMAYTSPYYFTKGIGGEYTRRGVNVGAYMEALASLYDRHGGLDDTYFDGVYSDDVENTYRVCRATRAFLGDQRLFMVHCTTSPPPGGLAYNPAADTYANFILRGEGQGFRNERWLRYFISGYNISNAVGVVCNNAGHWMPQQRHVEMTLRANCRLAYMPFDPDEWPDGATVRIVHLRPEVVERRHREALEKWYWPRLDASYRPWFERLNREGAFAIPPEPPEPPPYPMAGLSLSDLRAATSARLVYEVFGADGPKFRTPVELNGVPLGDLPGGRGDHWDSGAPMPLSPGALAAIGRTNRLTLANADRDCFKLRRLHLEFTLGDGRKAASNVVQYVYCSDGRWAHAEGTSVTLGRPLVIVIPVPVGE